MLMRKTRGFLSDLGEPLLALLDPRPEEVILDLGCGDGALTAKIASAGCMVVGIDSSFEQLKASRERGLAVAVMDGHHLCFRRRFDAVFTNAALHWMKQPESVVSGVSNCLRDGGRFVGEFGGKGNVETIRSALHRNLRKKGIEPETIDPWYYPSPDEYSTLLGDSGFSVETIQLIPVQQNSPATSWPGWRFSRNPSPNRSPNVSRVSFWTRSEAKLHRNCKTRTEHGQPIT